MVSKYSRHPEVAAEFVRYMAGPEAQKYRAISISHLPTIGRLYQDPEILAAQPFMERLFAVFNSAVARPSTVTGELYNEVSDTYFNTVHSVLIGVQTAEDALADLEEALIAITGLPAGPPPVGEVGATQGTLTGVDAEEGVEAEVAEGSAEAPANSLNFLNRDYEGTNLKVFFSAVGNEAASYGELIQNFTEQTGIEVEVVTAPDSATDNLTQQLQFLEAGFTDLDVYQIDVTWPGILIDHAVDLYDYIPQPEIEAHFPAIIANNTVEGKLVSLPWFMGAGLLYYRTDLLQKYGYVELPESWDELAEIAETIQEGERAEGNDNFWGFVWQGSNYEGLTCNALEWQFSNGGGQIIEPDGTITVNNSEAAAAFTQAADWIDTISPPEVVSYRENEAWEVWQSGNAAFMRNWPYAYALGNSSDSPIKGKFEVTLLPAGASGRGAATLGGWQLMVSQYSDNIEAATLFVRYMAGREAQGERAARDGYLPTIAGLYSDSEVLEAQPFMGTLFEVFTNSVARPSTVTGELYNEVSTAYFDTVHSILTGEQDAKDALLALEKELVDITGFEVGQPP
jgi:trehalose/maltose transport system substrate-binding protein